MNPLVPEVGAEAANFHIQILVLRLPVEEGNPLADVGEAVLII